MVEEQKAVPTWLTESAIGGGGGGDSLIPSGAVVGIDTLLVFYADSCVRLVQCTITRHCT